MCHRYALQLGGSRAFEVSSRILLQDVQWQCRSGHEKIRHKDSFLDNAIYRGCFSDFSR